MATYCTKEKVLSDDLTAFFEVTKNSDMSDKLKEQDVSVSHLGIPRRKAISLMSLAGLGALIGYEPSAVADNLHHALYGNWHVRCPNGHVDLVTQGTSQHKCSKCGAQCFVNYKVTVMCPQGHANLVALDNIDVAKSCKCATCHVECQGW